MDSFTQKKSHVGSIVLVILFFLLVAAIGLAVFFYHQLSAIKENPQKMVQEEIEMIVGRVGELMVLPENEQPTLATVADLTQLKGQPFFERAKVGDKVLFYANARKAILYDPVAHKILEVAPLNLGDNPPPPSVPETTGETQ